MIPKLPLNIIFIIAAQHSIQNHIFCVHGYTKNGQQGGLEGKEKAGFSQSHLSLPKKSGETYCIIQEGFLEPVTPDSCWSNCWADLLALYICWWCAARKPGLRKRGVRLTLEPAFPVTENLERVSWTYEYLHECLRSVLIWGILGADTGFFWSTAGKVCSLTWTV